MPAIYCTVEEVKKSGKFLDLEFLKDEHIVLMIETSQGEIDTLIKTSFLNNFSMPKHAVLKSLCINLTLVKCYAACPDAFYSVEDRTNTMESLWNLIKIDLKLLSDPSRVEMLK